MTLPGVGTGAPASRCLPTRARRSSQVQHGPVAFVEEQMLRSGCCAIALSLLLAGCGETRDPVHRSGTLVKTCPHLRTFYAWQNKLYLKEGNRYRQVDSNDVDLCEQVAGLASALRFSRRFVINVGRCRFWIMTAGTDRPHADLF